MRSMGNGICSYCGSEDVPVVPPTRLADFFQLLIGAYRRDDGGKLLVQWFREDWGMFEHTRMDDSRAKDLLGEILNDGEIVRQPFLPADYSGADRLGEWEKLRDELMYQNRYFPGVSDEYLNRLEVLLDYLRLDGDEVPNVWFRARIQTGDAMVAVDDMGAPPRGIASHGRANPAGIPYLYLGSTQETAISEIRPHTGERVCVVDFRTQPDLNLVDLRRPKKMVSPFLLEFSEAWDIPRMRRDLPVLERLGEELTRPVLPHSAAIDYTPSQYLCGFIKKCGYDGVVYRSSVGDGINLALFDPAKAQPGTVVQWHVFRVSVDARAV